MTQSAAPGFLTDVHGQCLDWNLHRASFSHCFRLLATEAREHVPFTGRIWPSAALKLEEVGLSPEDVQPSGHGGVIAKVPLTT